MWAAMEHDSPFTNLFERNWDSAIVTISNELDIAFPRVVRKWAACLVFRRKWRATFLVLDAAFSQICTCRAANIACSSRNNFTTSALVQMKTNYPQYHRFQEVPFPLLWSFWQLRSLRIAHSFSTFKIFLFWGPFLQAWKVTSTLLDGLCIN